MVLNLQFICVSMIGIPLRHRRDVGGDPQRETAVGVPYVRRRRQRLHRSAGKQSSSDPQLLAL